jgi:hypothetical protein
MATNDFTSSDNKLSITVDKDELKALWQSTTDKFFDLKALAAGAYTLLDECDLDESGHLATRLLDDLIKKTSSFYSESENELLAFLEQKSEVHHD